jgi:hypothetical protein
MNGALAEFLNMAKNPAIAADERENRIMALGRQADSEATRKLMALGDCARQVLEQMATIHSMDVVLPVKGNSTVTLRLVAKPEKMASDLLTHMQPRIPTRPKTIQNVVETFGAH